MQERRLALRRLVSEEIRFDCMSCGTQDEYRAEAHDVSRNGIRMETSHEIGRGQLLRIKPKELLGEPAYGRVIWAVPKKSGYEAGVSILDEKAERDFVWYEDFEG